MFQFAPKFSGINSLSTIDAHLSFLSSLSPGSEGEVDVSDVGFSDLPPFLRALLVADGTVTLLLKAYFDENISVETLDQSRYLLAAPLPALALRANDEIFFRSVRLCGAKSAVTYVEASSVLNPAALSSELFSALTHRDVGMGEVLRNAAKGSYRQVIDISRVSDNKMSRTYQVFMENNPAILITESFVVGNY